LTDELGANQTVEEALAQFNINWTEKMQEEIATMEISGYVAIHRASMQVDFSEVNEVYFTVDYEVNGEPVKLVAFDSGAVWVPKTANDEDFLASRGPDAQEGSLVIQEEAGDRKQYVFK
jgi:hypothetical protein